MKARILGATAFLFLGIFIGVATVPASAHVTGKFGHLWKKHIAPKLSSAEYVRGREIVQIAQGVPANQSLLVTVPCPAGMKVISGGWGLFGDGSVYFDAPSADGFGWDVSVDNVGGQESLMNGWAICVK